MSDRRSLFNLQNDIITGRRNPVAVYTAAKGSLDIVQRLMLQTKLEVHNGCVNTICWNDTGEYILSGSDDQHLKITNPYNHKIMVDVRSGHKANIFSAKFLPGSRDRHIVSCAGDGMIYLTDIEREDFYQSHGFNCHFGTCYEVVTVPGDSHSFLSCGEDGTVRWFDRRLKASCNKDDCKEDILINCHRAVTSLVVDPIHPYNLAVGCSDSSVRIFDRRMLGTRLTGNYNSRGITGMVSRFIASTLGGGSHRVTSLQYSSDSREMLVSYSSQYIYLFDVMDSERPVKKLDKSPYTNKEDASTSASDQVPPVKRLRLRGDWSDTGPRARPEHERDQSDSNDNPESSIMQRMSDMLTRWLNPNEQQVRNEERTTENDSQRNAATHDGTTQADTADDEVDSSVVNISQSETNQDTTVGAVASMELESHATTSSVGASHDDYFNNKERMSEKDKHVQTLRKTIESAQCTPDRPEYDSLDPVMKESRIHETQQNLVDETASVETDLNVLSSSCISTDKSQDNSVHAEVPQSGMPALKKPLTKDTGNQRNVAHSQSVETCKNDDDVLTQCDKSDSIELPLRTGKSQAVNDFNPRKDTCDEKHDLTDVMNENTNPSQVSGASSSIQPKDIIQSVNEGATSSNVASGENSASKKYTPCISLHYSSQSTTASTVKLHFMSNDENISETEHARMSTVEDRDEVAMVTEPVASGSPVTTGALVDEPAVATISQPSIDSSQQMRVPSGGARSRVPADSTNSRETAGASASSPLSRMSPEKRQRVATRLQEYYHKHQERKLEEELNASNHVRQPPYKTCFKGHRNTRTMIKEACFWGDDYVLSGSDCGHIFIWDRYTSQLVNILEADNHVVNCIQPHPFDPVLASSGIDYNIKLWMPYAVEPSFNVEYANAVTSRNEVMLTETRDTITVPASFMLRMLASLNHIRNVGREAGQESNSSDSEDNTE